MYGKPNKTEKRIINAWNTDNIDDAFGGLFGSGWLNDLTVEKSGNNFIQHLPKVHPEIIPLMAGVPYSSAQGLAKCLEHGTMVLDRGNSPAVVTVKDGSGLLHTILFTDTGLRIEFKSPVHVECSDRSGVGLWSVKLVYGAKPCVNVREI